MSNETFISMFPNLNTLASIYKLCLTIPIGTALVKLNHQEVPLKIAIKSLEKPSDSDLENIVDIIIMVQ